MRAKTEPLKVLPPSESLPLAVIGHERHRLDRPLLLVNASGTPRVSGCPNPERAISRTENVVRH